MPFSPLDVPYGSLDTKTDERLVANGALLVAENCSAQTVGGYTKRPGYTALTSIGATLVRLATDGRALFGVTDPQADVRVYDPVSATWNSRGGYASAIRTSQEIIAANTNVDVVIMSTAVANGMKVDCWIDSDGRMLASFTNVANGTRIKVQQLTAASYKCIRAVTVGTNVYIVFSDPTNQTISAVFANCTTATFGAATPLFTAANVDATLAQFDLAPLNATDVVLVWKTAGATVRAARITASTHVVNANQQIAAEAPDGPIGCFADSGTSGAAIYHSTAGGGMRACFFNPATMVQTLAPFTIEAVTTPVAVHCSVRFESTFGNGVGGFAVWDRGASGITKGYVMWRCFDSTGALDTQRGPIRNVLMASKMPSPAGSNAQPILNLYAKSTQQETFFTAYLLRTGAYWFFATHAYRSAYSAASVTNVLSDFATKSSNVFVWNGPLAYKALAVSTPNAAVTSFTCDMAAADRYSSDEIRDGFVLAGGMGTRCEGSNVLDQNFALFPEILTATPGAVVSGGMDDGRYTFTAIFEATDAQGNVDRSTMANFVVVDCAQGAGRNKVDLVLDQLHITRLPRADTASGKISLFRTFANAVADENDSLDFRYVGSAVISQGSATVTITDQMNDTVMASSRPLYTNGGVTEREPPPPSIQMVLHKNRIWVINSADRKSLSYSGELAVGEGAWYSSDQVVRVDDGGDITAIASLDDKLIIFKADRAFKLYGSGLNATQSTNDLSAPILITGDAGCTDHRSLVAANGGLLFKSAKGLYGLSRGEELSYVGESADKYWTNYANIVSANMMPDRQEVRFEVSGGAGVGDALTGVAVAAQKMVMNYVTGQWTTHRNYTDATAIDGIVAGGVYHWATSAGIAYKEDSTTFLDPASTFVRMLIRTGWVKPAGFQGWVRCQRAMHLGARKTPHSLTMTCENDYVATIRSTKTWTNFLLSGLPTEQVNLHLVRQKGQAYRFTTYDGSSGAVGTGEGSSMLGLQLYAQALKGTFEKKLLAEARG